MGKLRQNVIRHLGVFLFYAILTAAFTYPLILHLSQAVLGGKGDNLYFAWLTGWYEHAFLTQAGILFSRP